MRRLLGLAAGLALFPAGASAGPGEDLAVLARRLDDAELADSGRVAREALASARTAVGEAQGHLKSGDKIGARRAFARGKAYARLAEAQLARAQAEREARQAAAEADAVAQKAEQAKADALALEQKLQALQHQSPPPATPTQGDAP
ncbi:MAG: hypothetical protein H6702_13500 [Myxococcales bacterium]|nr:hypothetical protein [Myxococcales bacterium]